MEFIFLVPRESLWNGASRSASRPSHRPIDSEPNRARVQAWQRHLQSSGHADEPNVSCRVAVFAGASGGFPGQPGGAPDRARAPPLCPGRRNTAAPCGHDGGGSIGNGGPAPRGQEDGGPREQMARCRWPASRSPRSIPPGARPLTAEACGFPRLRPTVIWPARHLLWRDAGRTRCAIPHPLTTSTPRCLAAPRRGHVAVPRSDPSS